MSRIEVSLILVNCSCQRSKQHQRAKKDPPADCPVISEYRNLKKFLVVSREKRSILKDSIKCVLHIRSEVKLETFVNSSLFHFTKGLVLGNTIQ
jgi:rRNA maturation protein Rpf1